MPPAAVAVHSPCECSATILPAAAPPARRGPSPSRISRPGPTARRSRPWLRTKRDAGPSPAAFLGPGAGHGPRSAAGAMKSRSPASSTQRARSGPAGYCGHESESRGVPQLELETLWPVRVNKSLSRHCTRPLPVGLEPGEVTVAGSRAKSRTRTAAALAEARQLRARLRALSLARYMCSGVVWSVTDG